MGILESAVSSIEASATSEIEEFAREALDVSLVLIQEPGKRGAPGRATVPSPGSSGNLRIKLWENLEKLFQESIYNQCIQMELLQRILLENHSKKFDNMSEPFWTKVTNIVANILVERAQGEN